jgi:hypothetical protein
MTRGSTKKLKAALWVVGAEAAAARSRRGHRPSVLAGTVSG